MEESYKNSKNGVLIKVDSKKIKEAKTTTERLAAILEIAVSKGKAKSVPEFMAILQPFVDLIESSALHSTELAGKIIGQALREKTLLELGMKQSSALFAIAEIIRKLELD